MATLLLENLSNENTELLLALAKKLGVKISKLDKDDKEDFFFGQMMVDEETEEYVTKEEIIKILEND